MKEQAFDKNDVGGEDQNNRSNEQNEYSEEELLALELNVDDSVSGMQHLDDEIGEESELEKLREEANDAKDKYLRLVAEFENFRKRNAKERVELIATAGKDVIQSLLVVLDDMDRASKQLESETDVKRINEGVSLVFNKLRNTMQQKGLTKMTSINHPFDPDLHEAITEIPAPESELVGKVIDEIEPGYYLNDKLIRHAKVIVGK